MESVKTPDRRSALGREHSPDRERPLASYAVLMATFSSLAAAFASWFHRSGRALPPRIDAGDLALLTVASHKAARMITKDRVTSAVRAPFTRFEGDAGPGEVNEAARGRGLQRAIGELLVCPYCLGMWTSAALTASLLVFPRFTRWFATVLTMFFGSEMLQLAYRRAEAAVGR
ncbi:MAG: hypothetical protein QOF83_754 [Solirubrobacteraceae bacterium]|jgi:hypothetical protein|nr:hypothetical protein [Solirubrobacteraceae bacterium]